MLGATCTLPLVAFVVVTVTNEGPVTFVNVSASPSGSEPVMTWSTINPSITVVFEIAFSVGARLLLFTVIVSDLSSNREPSLARTVAPAVPASENPGAKWRFPAAVPFPGEIVVTAAYVGPETSENVSASPSWSVASSAWFAVSPSFTVMSDGWARTGAWFVAVTVIVRLLSLFRLPSLARTVAEEVPSGSAAPAARWMFPVVAFVVVTDA